MNEKKLLTQNEIVMADVISGKVLITDCVVEDFYKSISTSFLSYVKFNAEPMSLEEMLDCAMRVVLIPHHSKIDELQSQVEQLEKLARDWVRHDLINIADVPCCKLFCRGCKAIEALNSILGGRDEQLCKSASRK